MNVEEIPAEIEELKRHIGRLETALLFAGICPHCGRKIKPKVKENGQAFVCPCGQMTWLANSAIKETRR
jgi:predicted RNA-binding Zn-ribbon protein involved in translation (DUF1610 family)